MRELFRGFWVVGYREILRLLSQRARLLSSFATPLLFFVLFGAGFNRLVGSMAPGIDFITFMFPGIVAMTVIMPSIFTGMSVVWDREFGFLREVLVAPLSRTGIVLGKVAGGALVASGEGLVLLVLAPVVGLRLGPAQLAELVPLLLLLSVALAAFGILVGVRLRTQETFQTVMALLVFPLVFLSGIFFPVEATPRWLALVAKLNPVTYGVDAIRQVLLQGHVAATLGALAGAGGNAPFPGGAPGGPAPLPPGGGETHPLGVVLFGHTAGVWEEALALLVLGALLVAAASRSFARQE